MTLPPNISSEIRALFGARTKGFGSIKVEVCVGSTRWNTSIFPDTKSKSYLLPVKKMVRSAEHINEGQAVKCKIRLLNSN